MLTLGAIGQHLDALAKPTGSLGRIEQLTARLCFLQQTLSPVTTPRRLVLFAGDHGVVAEGVSAWPQRVTTAVAEAIRHGGAASAVLAKTTETELVLVDVGMAGARLSEMPGYHDCRIRSGTRNLADGPAMTAEEFTQAFHLGERFAHQASDDGMSVIATGEMGIGNTTAASCLIALLGNFAPPLVVGPGAGSTPEQLVRKVQVVHHAVTEAKAQMLTDPLKAMAAVSGFEIVAMAGFLRAGVLRRRTVILDGFIATSAALIAEQLFPGTSAGLIAAHRSAEPGHGQALALLRLDPCLDGWQLRLGEGTGALLLMPLLDAAAALSSQMASLSSLERFLHGN